MGFAGMALIFAIFFVPELRGRSLEEVDELFSKFRCGWEYTRHETTGVGAAVARVEHGEQVDLCVATEEDRDDEKNTIANAKVQVLQV
jgi:SP family sugar:H+ symporter-like MFS transporter